MRIGCLGLLALFFAFFFGTTVIYVVGNLFDDGQHGNNHNRQSSKNDGIGHSPNAIGAWSAISAVIVATGGVVVSYYQHRSLRRANSISRQTAIAARESVSSYHEGERGRMFMVNPSVKDDKGYFVFCNMGRTPVVITGFHWDVRSWPEEQVHKTNLPPPVPFDFSQRIYLPIEAGGNFGDVHGPGHRPPIPVDHSYFEGKPFNYLVVSGYCLRYETTFGTYRCRFTCSHDKDGRGFVAYLQEPYYADEPANDST